jgi:phenylpropionate dioxygenase-like ring-hydroxylating dioxygenase large terminal subunit
MPDDLASKLKADYWHLICHRCQIASPGDFVRFDWFDEELVAYNDHGDILLFDNICPHRGARIFTQAEGSQRLRCGYHGWTYQRGKFYAPFPAEFEKEELERAAFATLQKQWCGDFLFGGISPKQTLHEQLGDLWETLFNISASIALPHSSNIFIWESDWRIAIENALEQYHTHVGLVHTKSFGKHKTNAGQDAFFGKNSLYRCEYLDQRTTTQLGRLGRFFDLRYQHPGYQSIYLFPFAMIGSTFGYSYALQNFYPAATAGRTHFSSRMLTSKLIDGVDPLLVASFFDAASEINKVIFDEDHEICKRVSAKSLRDDFKPILAKSEAKIARFRAALEQS